MRKKVVKILDIPRFDVEKMNQSQITPVSLFLQQFSELQKKAEFEPQFISNNNKIDSVLLSFYAYKNLEELKALRTLVWEYELASRIHRANENPNNSLSLKDVMGEDEFLEFQNMDLNDVKDEDLFE